MQKQEESIITELITNFPALGEFLNLNRPAETVDEANKYLTTNQILIICNDVIFNEELNEQIVYKFLKLNNYQITDIGNDTMYWIIKN
jgi:hypothetical protein